MSKRTMKEKVISEHEKQFIFSHCFKIFPLEDLSEDAVGFDLGQECQRWSEYINGRVNKLYSIKPGFDCGILNDSMDFGFSLSILEDPQNNLADIKRCIRKLKPGAPFLFYIYNPKEKKFFSRISLGLVKGILQESGLENVTSIDMFPYRYFFGHKCREDIRLEKRSNVLFLSKYARNAASTRYRFLQYIPYLQKYGFNCVVSSLFEEKYLVKRFNTGTKDFIEIFISFLKRIGAILKAKKYDLVFLYCEAIPYFPEILELFLKWKRISYVYDFDDAIFHNYDQHPSPVVRFLFRNKIKNVIKNSELIIAGNKYLGDYARTVNNKVVIIPTVIDIELYPKQMQPPSVNKTFTIGWIGSPSTAPYLKAIESPLREFCRKFNAKVLLIGSGKIELSGVPLEIRQWSEETEIKDLQDFDCGIMPLPDSLWARGKCGFKIIQYMACRLPVIASPVGVNLEMVDNWKNGFLAANDNEWIEYLSVLYNDAELRKRMGEAGRKKAELNYSLQNTAPRLCSLIVEIIKNKDKI